MRHDDDRQRSLWPRVLLAVGQALVPGAVFVLGIFLRKPQSTWLIAALAVTVAVTASTIAALLIGQHYLRRMEATVQKTADKTSQLLVDIGQAALIRAEGRDGLTQEKLSEYESRMDVQTIWIVGANFDSEITSNAPFLTVVKRNIHEREVNYVYIAPDLNNLHYKLDRLRQELDLDTEDKRLLTLFLTTDEWQRLPYTAGNFTIYDPERKGHPAEGYFWDPGGDGESFIALRRQVVADWVGDIQQIRPELRDANHDAHDDAGRQARPRRARPLRPRRVWSWSPFKR